MIIRQTLVIIQQNKRVLLGMKKRGFGQGRWNGFGGKIKKNESNKDAAKRELWEEALIRAEKLKKIGILKFIWIEKDDQLAVHIFKAEDYSGHPKETEEMKPRWFTQNRIPFKKMWPDDQYWFKYFLANKKFKGSFKFDQNDRIVSRKLKKVDTL
jgi:8-oxo-dGTP diphosphatase / 2-hydroxy-dATP diphosphatase